MRQVQQVYNVYKFDELSEQAKENAISKLYDINIFHDWYECTYEDAATIGLKITSFDLDRNKHTKGALTDTLSNVIAKIVENHGPDCDTTKLALEYREKMVFVSRLDTEDSQFEFEQESEELKTEFEKELLECYASVLQRDFDYLTSNEAIKETIACNDYEFLESGELV